MPGEALARLTGALEAYGSWTNGRSAQCPHHDDGTASLSVGPRRDGRGVVIECHAGCDYRDVLADLGLTVGDLYDEGGPTRELVPSPRRAPDAARKPRKPKPRPRGQIVAEYPYTDEDGNELFRAVRYEPKGFSQCRMVDGRRVPGLGDARRVLYRLPKVIEAVRNGRPVWVCGGEKDVEALERAGVTATTNPMGEGPGKWLPEFSACLAGADVVIVADRDDTGRAHAEEIVRSLKGRANRICVIEAAEGKDAADHLGAGRSLAEFALVSEVCGATKESRGSSAAKLRDLRELARKSARRTFLRPMLDNPGHAAKRACKLTIETGSTRPGSPFYHSPHELWTCPDPDAAMDVYERIMTGERLILRDFGPADFGALAYQITEQLITIGPGDIVVPLGDRRASAGAKYPGAPSPNAPAGGGGKKQLRHRADDLIMAAYVTMALAGTNMRASGLRAAARELCEVANDIKSKRPDLDEYRYLSVDTCSRAIRRMLRAGKLAEAEAPRKIREHRTWRTIPRVLKVIPETITTLADQLGLRPPLEAAS